MTDLTYRNRHNREEHHFGTMESTLVELSSALGADLPAGMTLEDAIGVINARITHLENVDVWAFGIKADAYIGDLSIFANAVLKASFSGTLTSDATLLAHVNGSFASDAAILKSVIGSMSADAYLQAVAGNYFTASAILLVIQTGTFTANAILLDTATGSVTANAAIMAVFSGSLAADAVVTDGSPLGGFLADAIVKASISGSLLADAIRKATITSGAPGGMTLRYGTYQEVPATPGTYTQDFDVGTNPKAVGIFVINNTTASLTSITTWTFDGASTECTYVLQENYIGRRVYLFDNLSPAAMSGTVEVKLVLTNNWGPANFVPFAINNADTITRLDTNSGAGPGSISLYSFDTGSNQAIGLVALDGTAGTGTTGLTSFFSSPPDYNAGYETAAPETGSRSIGFTGGGTHAWIGVAYGLGAIEPNPSPTADAVIFATSSGSWTADAVIMPTFTIDAVVISYPTFTIDAVIMPVFTIDAVIGTPVKTFTADAYISSGAAAEESTLGDMTLADNTLGG